MWLRATGDSLLPHERQTRQDLSDRIAVGGRQNADRHGLAVALEDDVASHVGAFERLRESEEVVDVPRVQSDGYRAGRNADVGHRRGLAGGVDGLRNLRPSGEIGADDDVVNDLDGLTVNACRHDSPARAVVKRRARDSNPILSDRAV